MQSPEMVRTYTLDEVASILQCSYATAYRLTERGELDCLKIGTKPLIRVTTAQLDRYLQGKEGEKESARTA